MADQPQIEPHVEAFVKAEDAKQQEQLDTNSQKLGPWGMLTTPQGIAAIFAGIMSLYAAYRSTTNPAAEVPPIRVEIVSFPEAPAEPVVPPTKQAESK